MWARIVALNIIFIDIDSYKTNYGFSFKILCIIGRVSIDVTKK